MTDESEDVFLEAKRFFSKSKEERMADIVRNTAKKIAALPRLEQHKVAGYMAYGFAQQNVPISRNFLYAVLGPEYKEQI